MYLVKLPEERRKYPPDPTGNGFAYGVTNAVPAILWDGKPVWWFVESIYSRNVNGYFRIADLELVGVLT